MALPRTFVGFSSTDLHCYRLMTAWKAHEHIDFDFCNCQLQDELNSQDEAYIKRRCRERLNMAGYYLILIGEDTRSKHKGTSINPDMLASDIAYRSVEEC